MMTACGASPKAISLELNVPLEVITTHYSADMDIGLDIANARVAKVFYLSSRSQVLGIYT